jgi:cytochrome c5
MKTMAEVSLPARALLALPALLAGVFLAACGSEPDDPPVQEDPGPATGSVCPSDETLTYENFGMDFFESYCTRCHSEDLTGSARHGAPIGFNWDDIDAVRENAERIDKMAAGGPVVVNTIMPPNDPRPSDEERQALGEWLVCGAP